MEHKSGFVSIIGRPNAGKSTLINAMVGEKLSIITSKAQTTRHRILGILNSDDYQLVLSDTPGIIKPGYLLHERMMNSVSQSMEDADVVLLIMGWDEKSVNEEVLAQLKRTKAPVLLVLNKIDLATTQEEVMERVEKVKQEVKCESCIPVSAKEKFNLGRLMEEVLERIPEAPPYFPKDQLTDRSERFFASEIIREKIFMYLKEELPYSCEVDIVQFQEEETINRIYADIYVMRDSQKAIVIGAAGKTLKKIGTEARKEMEVFFGKKVYLEQYVKVRDDWRNDENYLKSFGYTE